MEYPDYGSTIDTIAPGFTAQIQAQGVPEEPWYETASRIFSNVVMTSYQYQLLQVQVDRARAGLPPAPIPGVTSVSPATGGIVVDKPAPPWVLLAALGLGVVVLSRK